MRNVLLLVLGLAVLFALLAGYEGGSAFQLKKSTPSPVSPPSAAIPSSSYSVDLLLPAVSRSGEGSLAQLRVHVVAGKGRMFLQSDSANPLTNPDTQYSIRTAFEVAKQLAEADANALDVYYSISADSDVVGGQSAGAGVAVATLAALEGAKLKENVLITGSVDPQGGIGKVGKVLQKARAAKAAGYSMLLVPVGERTYVEQKQVCKNEVIQDTYYQTCTTQSVTVDAESEVGLQVVEVADVLEAYRLMKE